MYRYEQMVVGQIKFEREKRRDSMAPVPPRLSRSQSARVDSGKARRLSDTTTMSPASPHIRKANSVATGLRGSRASRERLSASSSPRTSVSSMEARIEAKMALAASRRYMHMLATVAHAITSVRQDDRSVLDFLCCAAGFGNASLVGALVLREVLLRTFRVRVLRLKKPSRLSRRPWKE